MSKNEKSEEATPWSPFRFRRFRWYWSGSLAINLAIWMQNVGAAWMMVTLTPSPFLVALVQTAISLPAFFFGLPGGVFADIFDRRRYLMVTQAGMLVMSLVLVGSAYAGVITPIVLLALTFCFGIGFALQGPAWYTTQAESVSHQFMPAAMALSSVAYSSARAVGPAIAGGVVAISGIVTVFALCSLLLLFSFLVISFVRSEKKDSGLPPETLWAGLKGAVRYTRNSDIMWVPLVRTIAFVSAASAVWALLPVVAADTGGGAGSYGVLLGSIGGGTMFAALLLPVLRAYLEVNKLIVLACLVYAGGMLLVAAVPVTWVQGVALFLSGIGWMCIGTTHLVVIQTAVPPWIRARAVAIYMLVFQGSLAIGGAMWGMLADALGSLQTLNVASAFVLASIFVMNRFPARQGDESEAMPSSSELPVFTPSDLDPRTGPVAVQVEYQIERQDRKQFLVLIRDMGTKRRRNGASFWRIYRDLENPGCYTERFIVDSWSEYLRHQTRATQADQILEARVHSLHSGNAPPKVSHFITERLPSNGETGVDI